MTTEALHALLARDLRRWFARRVSDPTLVDDLLQETFLRVHRGLPGLRDQDRVAPWVYRVAQGVWVDHLRRRRPGEALAEDPVVEDVPLEDPDAVVAGWLPRMIDGLPEPYREALRLSELEGLTQAELARRLGLSPSGARTRVQRGRAKLREALDACCTVRWADGGVVDWARVEEQRCRCG